MQDSGFVVQPNKKAGKFGQFDQIEKALLCAQ